MLPRDQPKSLLDLSVCFRSFWKIKDVSPQSCNSVSHAMHCLLMRINTFDVFLYGSLLMPCSRMVKPLQLEHPEASFAAASCHTAQVILSYCVDRWQSSVCRHWSSLMGSREHFTIRQHGGQTAVAWYITGKSHRPSIKESASQAWPTGHQGYSWGTVTWSL